jgi:hypothetical protein
MSRCTVLFGGFFFTLTFIGCTSTPYVTVRDLPSRAKSLNSIVLLPPEVKIYEVDAAGNLERKDDWAEKGKENIQRGIFTAIQKKYKLQIKNLVSDSTDEAQKKNLSDILALYGAVNNSIVRHAYAASIDYFKNKKENFDYTLDTNITHLSPDADAFLIIYGKDYIASSGRTAAQVGSVILGALIGIQVTPNSLPTIVGSALIDAKTGEVLWHSLASEQGSYNLRDLSEDSSLFKKMLSGFPLE